MGNKTRPPGWECPGCGPHGVPVDFSISEEKRICECCADKCGPCAICQEFEDRLQAEDAKRRAARQNIVEDLRAILRGVVKEVGGGQRWPGCEYGKAIIGNAILSALKDYGCDSKEELHMAAEGVNGGKCVTAPETIQRLRGMVGTVHA